MIKLSDYVIKYISTLGIKDVFYLSGGGCMHLIDSLGRNESVNGVANLHEQCSTIGANGYSQYTGNLGVAIVTTGPGGTNAITGVAAAWIDSNPILVISGQVKRSDMILDKKVRQMGPQEIDIISIVKPITKYAKTIMDPNDVKKVLDEAVFYANEGRKGPVWVDIPLDVQGSYVEENELLGFNEPIGTNESIENIEDIYELINKSKRPVMLIGNGVRLSKSESLFIKLAEQLRIPVLTTWRSLDLIDENHDLYFGRPGAIGQRCANFIQQNSDLFISVGARLDLGQIGFDYSNMARKAKKIVVDIDKFEIEKIKTNIDIKLPISAFTFFNEMIKNIDSFDGNYKEEWLKQCNSYKDRYPVIIDEFKNNKSGVNTYYLVDEISKLLNEEDIIVPGSSGTCSEVTSQCIKIKKGQRFINSPGLGSMGFGVAESIGVCIASGGKRTICLIGDGGLQHNIQELELLRRYNLPIKVFVLNNNIYASIRLMQNRIFNGNLVGCDTSSGVTIPDTIKIANAYNIKSFTIYNQDNLDTEIREVLEFDGPCVCDVHIDPEMVTLPRTSSVVLEDGSIISKPLEDLWPFLDREEFDQNMIINSLEE